MLNLRHIQYFIAVADSRSISAAAETLGMAQPSLSESIVRLEQHFGTELAIRSARGIELTEAGSVLAQHGRRLLDMCDMLTDEVRQVGGLPSGQLTLALPPSLGLVLSVPLAETVLHDLPDLRLHITEGMSRHILSMVEEEAAHLGCVYDIADPEKFAIQPLMTEELYLVTAVDNWDGEIGANGFATEPIGIERLAELPLVVPNNSHGARTVIERAAKAGGVKLNVVCQIDPLPQIIEMVDRASAYSILPQTSVMSQVRAGRIALVPIQGGAIKRTAYMVRKRARPMSTGVQQIQKLIISIMSEMIRRHGLGAVVLTGGEAG